MTSSTCFDGKENIKVVQFVRTSSARNFKIDSYPGIVLTTLHEHFLISILEKVATRAGESSDLW